MTLLATVSGQSAIEPLRWDSDHFGFPVARIAGDATDQALYAALQRAREQGYRLVYWATDGDREAPSAFLSEFGGRLVDRKVTFARRLSSDDAPTTKASPIAVRPWEQDIASSALVALAIAAGVFSRFGADPRIPRDKFESLYRIWIERSVRGEIADAVLVAQEANGANGRNGTHENKVGGSPAGMITLQARNGSGNIGLIAVAQNQRGRGIGSLLMAAAHRWMIDRGLNKATVVTQTANALACRLYERAGYTVERAENYYHFWL